MQHALWNLERAFWLGGVDVYQDHLAADALMVFPAPVGVLDRAATLAAIEAAPRWRSALFSAQRTLQPAADVFILCYAVHAKRDDAQPGYAALCSSTYVRQGEQWRLVLHQQTPSQGSA